MMREQEMSESNPRKIVIVGGVAGGATAAARLRRLDEKAHLIIVERGKQISFANCGLPYYVGGTIKSEDKLIVQTVQGLTGRYKLDIRIQSEVIGINRNDKTLRIKNLQTGLVYDESYDHLILSPGAGPIVPPIEGVTDNPAVFTLRTIPDAVAIVREIERNNAQTAIVAGGGFIGLEMAENLKERGLNVSLVEATEQVMPSLDYEMACLLHAHLREKGVNLILQDSVTRLEKARVTLKSGRTIEADIVILAIGVQPENMLAVQAGLETGEKGAIRVNEYFQTNDASIFAIGDAIEVKNYITGVPVHIPLAWPANRQGRLVADNLAGFPKPYHGTLGTSIAKVFDLTAASTGVNEKILQKQGISYKVIHIHPNSHAGYYPGALPITLKMIFSEEGKIYGAQAVGHKGVDKRIDVLATAIKGSLSVYDLQNLELAYAPPYSSGKDPVNLLGYSASNILDGLVGTVQYHEIDALVKEGNILVDVRQPDEVELGKIPGSVNIPLSELRGRLSELPEDRPVYVTCQVGLRGYVAARILAQNGYNAINLDGGYRTYSSVYPLFREIGAASNSPYEKISDAGTKAAGPSASPPLVPKEIAVNKVIDATCMQCPGPIKMVFENMKELEPGQVLEVAVTDPGFPRDIEAWCLRTGNSLLRTDFDGESYKAYIQKGNELGQVLPEDNSCVQEKTKGATLIVFDQDMDKALASFIIATGAASMGKPVTMFFTFWGLNILRKNNPPVVKKDSLAKAFGMMMPRGPQKLPISNLNMAGIGAKMINFVMKRKHVDSLESMLNSAMKMGIKLVACSMSMDIMGIKKEELLDGVEIGGVAAYLSQTEDANLNLFV